MESDHRVGEPDKYTVVYHLKRPYSPYIPTFFGSAGANPSVLPKHLLSSPNINDIPTMPNPWALGLSVSSIGSVATPSTWTPIRYYFRGLSKLKRITYKLVPSLDTLVTLMQTGEVDLWPEVPPPYILRMKATTRVRTDVSPGTSFAHLDFNVARPLVSDVRVREAVRYAIDRAANRREDRTRIWYRAGKQHLAGPAVCSERHTL